MIAITADGSHGMDDLQREKFAVAAHLYTRLRRSSGRAIDVMWMIRDERYAREVLEMARASPDAQVQHYALRYTELLAGIRTRVETPATPPAMPALRAATAPPAPAVAHAPEPAPEPASEAAPLPDRYVRSLR